jgi:hypothetical protein
MTEASKQPIWATEHPLRWARVSPHPGVFCTHPEHLDTDTTRPERRRHTERHGATTVTTVAIRVCGKCWPGAQSALQK